MDPVVVRGFNGETEGSDGVDQEGWIESGLSYQRIDISIFYSAYSNLV